MNEPLCCRRAVLALILLAAASAAAMDHHHDTFVLTSTNNASDNQVVVFQLTEGATPALTMVNQLATGGKGGASTNAGAVQFQGEFGAVVDYGTNDVAVLQRRDNSISVEETIPLASGCTAPVSVALRGSQAYIVGSSCAESHRWPSGRLDGTVVSLTDATAAQIAVGNTWAAVTLTDGSLLHLPLGRNGALTGTSTTVTLPTDASTIPLGEAFWGDLLGFTPAHSVDSFALVNAAEDVYPVPGPTPIYPTNAPCWVAKGGGNIWYTGNSPGGAISIFFSDGQGGVFYKSVTLPGSPTDITVSPDGSLLAVIYSAAGDAYVAVYSIDNFGDLSPVATSTGISGSPFSGVAFSQQ